VFQIGQLGLGLTPVFAYAYHLAAREGDMLVYESDENLELYGGADYKEPAVFAGIEFRHRMHGIPYKGNVATEDCTGAPTGELQYIDRGDIGAALLSGNYAGVVRSFPNLTDGLYREITSGRLFAVKGGVSDTTIEFTPFSAVFLVRVSQDEIDAGLWEVVCDAARGIRERLSALAYRKVKEKA
jgi:hypothetical protein